MPLQENQRTNKKPLHRSMQRLFDASGGDRWTVPTRLKPHARWVQLVS